MLPIGVQLYSLREEAQKDFVGVLKFVADVGYKYVEPAGFWDVRPSEFLKIIKDLGMDMVSSHSPWCRPGNIGEVMELADNLGLDKVVCGFGPADFENVEAMKRTAEQVNYMGEILAKNGFILFQHNHDFEFQRIDGKLKYDIYREMLDVDVKLEMDSFWSTNLGNEDPVEMLKHYADDTILLHMKDGVAKQKVGGDNMVNGILERDVKMMPLGTGELPIVDLMKAAPAQTQAVIVELDTCIIDMKTAIRQSYEYMISNGLAEGNK
jgi:sugar phosphate isomerase/epimerase